MREQALHLNQANLNELGHWEPDAVHCIEHTAALELRQLKLSDELLNRQRDRQPPAVKRATLTLLDITLRLPSHLVRISSAQTSNSIKPTINMHLSECLCLLGTDVQR